ncbi:alpha-ketoglutarate-dependent dioxygenase alkB homolog 7, mitochondrial isoform X1 [Macrotis lagotis]|uniref:alpha-ketoglutarate-dependent dioxygenase alkB homolog 7, mitochondrial isoform X1 n=1 Tax=Macrotis lagotis TaxID=92651 RepID=UPI003D6839C3
MGPELRTGSGARPPRASGRGGARAASLGRPGPDVASLRPCPRPRRSAGQGRSRRLSGEPVGYLVASSGPRSGRMPGGGAGGSQSGLGDVAEGKRGGGPGRSHPAGAGHHGGERPPGPARAAGPGPGLLPRLAPRLRARRAPPAAGGGRGAAGLPELGGGGGAEAGAGARAAAPPLPAIHGFRETEKLHWSAASQAVLQRVRAAAFPPALAQLPLVHVLDLHQSGYIKPHVDSVKFCGGIIAGLSLLSPSVMRLVDTQDPQEWLELLLESGSLYILRGPARYDFSHEILRDEESYFGEQRVPRGRRISVICRSLPEGEAKPSI